MPTTFKGAFQVAIPLALFIVGFLAWFNRQGERIAAAKDKAIMSYGEEKTYVASESDREMAVAPLPPKKTDLWIALGAFSTLETYTKSAVENPVTKEIQVVNGYYMRGTYIIAEAGKPDIAILVFHPLLLRMQLFW